MNAYVVLTSREAGHIHGLFILFYLCIYFLLFFSLFLFFIYLSIFINFLRQTSYLQFTVEKQPATGNLPQIYY